MTQTIKLDTIVLDDTIPLTIILKPDTVHEDGVNGVPPFTETLHETVVSAYVLGNVIVAVSDEVTGVVLNAVV